MKLDAPPSQRRRSNRGEAGGRRALITSIILGSIAVHALILVAFGLWTVAKRFSRPEARFEVKEVVKIPAKAPEHQMNVAKHEAMASTPTRSDQLLSQRPIDFALPEMPEMNFDEMMAMNPSDFLSDQVSSLVGSAALGSSLESGALGEGSRGGGMSFFGLEAKGERILLLFDVSASVVNKAEAAGIPLERIQEETIRLLEQLPISAQFSLIQFTGNYMPFTEELIVATPKNKRLAQRWVEERWVTSGSMSSSSKAVVKNLTGIVGILERAKMMQPEVIFLISDASFQWRPDGGSSYKNVPYPEIKETMANLVDERGFGILINFIAFQPKPKDSKEWSRIVKGSGGLFQELSEK